MHDLFIVRKVLGFDEALRSISTGNSVRPGFGLRSIRDKAPKKHSVRNTSGSLCLVPNIFEATEGERHLVAVY
jgi:hypothetical protein